MISLLDPRHIAFVLDEVLQCEEVLRLPAFAGLDRAAAGAMLDAAETLARAELLASYGLLDAHEPRMENGRVVLPGEIGTALEAMRTGGFFGMTARPEHGGLGLPRTIANAVFLWFQAANVSIANYAMLTMSAAELLAHHGTEAQRTRYMRPMIEGRFYGTMALSEPQAGSSLGDITTSAKPLGDGRYALRGTKMWISGGEHEMGENIVHLMLARIVGAPAGVKGISLFIVPRKRLDDDGRPGIWNNVVLAGLNHKMGQRGTVNTVLNVGEGGETIGELIGALGGGLACMFTMMNEARIGVSMGAVAHASAGFLHALGYARDRLQGRLPDTKDPASPQVALVAHADVRRLLLQQKAAAEGGIAFGLRLAKLADLKAAAATEAERADAGLLLDLLTPVFKAWLSEECLTANWNAMQVLGGAGYTRDHPVEQYYRDNRLNPIHEGTNGIQAIDLLGRKLGLGDCRPLVLLTAEISFAAQSARGTRAEPVGRAADRGVEALADAYAHLARVRQEKGATAQLAHAADVMEIAGCTALLWMWTEMADAAHAALARKAADPAFYEGKILAAEAARALYEPRLAGAVDRICSGTAVHLAIRDEMLG